MIVHPLRWLQGGALLGPDPSGPPCCVECSLPLPWDWSDVYCPTCRSIVDERKERERQRAEAAERGEDPDDQADPDGDAWMLRP